MLFVETYLLLSKQSCLTYFIMALLLNLAVLALFSLSAVFSYNLEYACLGDNEEYKDCGTACPLTCDRPVTGPCTLECAKGCFCKEGLFRDKISGRCVTEAECQDIISGGY